MHSFDQALQVIADVRRDGVAMGNTKRLSPVSARAQLPVCHRQGRPRSHRNHLPPLSDGSLIN